MRPADVALRLGISLRHAYYLCNRLGPIRIGSSVRLSRRKLEAFIKRGGDPGIYDRRPEPREVKRRRAK